LKSLAILCQRTLAELRLRFFIAQFSLWEWGLHTLIHTFALEIPLQYFGASLENAEFLAPLFFFPTFCVEATGRESVN